MPLGAFQPHDQLYVYEEDGRLAGLARVERDANRDEWTVVELDAVDHGDAGDIRYRLVQHLLRDGSRRGAARFHVACADKGGNVELFMQAGFARYGEEIGPLPGPRGALPGTPVGRPGRGRDPPRGRERCPRAEPTPSCGDAGARGAARGLPHPRLGAHREPCGGAAHVADAAAALRGSRGLRPGDRATARATSSWPSSTSAWPRSTSRTTSGSSRCPSTTPPTSSDSASRPSGRASAGSGHARPTATGTGSCRACARTRRPLDRRLEEHGLRAMARVSLLMKEALVRVAEPALVPAIR